MFAHVPSFGRNPRGSPDFLAYPVPKVCMHVLGTRVPRRLGVARSASSPKAALALGCSLTPGLRISFGRVTCMARAASVPGLWALGFLLLACVFWLGPGCVWWWVSFTPARCGWGLGWVCLGSVCGVVPLLPAVCGVRGWALVSACFRDLCGSVRVSLAPRRFRFRCAVWACVMGPGLGCAPPFLAGWSGCVFCGCWLSPSRDLWSLPPSPFFRAGLLAFFFFFFLLVSVLLFPLGRCSWLGVAGFGWLVPLYLFGGPVFGALWVGGLAPFCVVGGGLVAVGCFRAPTPPFFLGGGGGGAPGCSSLCLSSAGACSVAGVWCGWSLATPGGGSCVLLPATPGWVSLPVVVGGPRHSWLGSAGGGGVWRWCVGEVVAGVWCGWSLATPGGGSCVLLPATPGWVSLPLVVGGPRHSWLGSACGNGVWCVVCGGGVLVGLWRVCGVVGPSPLLAVVPVCYSPPLLAGFRCRWWWAVPATPGWGPLAAVVCGVWCVVSGVWCVAVVCWWGCSGVWCGWSLATPGGGSCVLLPATPGWVSLPLVVGGPRHSWLGSACGGGVWCVVCGGGVLVGLWRVCGVVGPSPLLAVVPVCYSPPLLAGFRCRWWWAVPATPGWGPLAAVVCGVWCVVCGVWCVAVVCWWGCSGVWCGWSLATPGGGSCVLLPATPGWVSLPLVVGGPRHSWLGSACGGGVWCVVCGGGVLVGLWLVCGVVGPSPLLAEVPVCYSPPLLAGFRCRWWWAVPATPGWGPLAASVCGVWRWCVVGVVVGVWCGWSLATPGGGPCVLLPATPGWVSLPVVVGGPRHSWLGSAGGAGVWCVVCCWGSSPLLAEVPVCYSLPLLAGFRCRWWRAVPATPGWGPLAAVVCVLCLAGSGGPASRARSGAPHHFLWPLCLSALLGPLRAGVAPLSFAAVAVPRWLFFSASRCLARGSFVSPAWPLTALWWLFPRPPPTFVSGGFRRSCLWPLCFFFFSPSSSSSVRPRCHRLSLVSAPGCPGPRRLRCLFCWPSASRLSVRLSLFRAFRLAVGCSRVVAAPPPPLVSRGFRSCRSVLCAVLCCACPGAVLRRAAACCVARCCAVVCCVALAWCRCLLRRALWRCLSPSGPVLCGAVFCGVPPRCVLCAVCVLSWRGGACCCSPLCLVLCVSRGAVLCVPCALRSVRCCASLCWCARVVLFVWCVLLLAPGAVVRCCVLCCFLWCAVVRCWVWWPVVVCWWRVSVSVSLSGRVVCFPVVGVVCCGALLSCVVFCGAVLSRGAVPLCSAVVLRCCWGLLCPPVGRRAVLCCAVGWLCCFWPGGGVCVLWCSFPRAVRSLSSPLCALVVLAVVPCFPVSCAVALCCRVVLCCRALLSFCGAVCVCFALLRPVVRRPCGLRCCWCLVLWRVPVRCGVSLGVLRCGGAALVCRGVLLCCALSCGVLRSVPCPAVPCCPAVLCWLAVLCGCLRCWCLFCPLFFC